MGANIVALRVRGWISRTPSPMQINKTFINIDHAKAHVGDSDQHAERIELAKELTGPHSAES